MGFLYVKTSDGKKKPSVWVWLFLLGLILAGSIFLVSNKRVTGMDKILSTDKAQRENNEGPSPMEMGESSRDIQGLDAEAINQMNEQIDREKAENNGWISKERLDEIKRKYEEETLSRSKSNFQPTVDERLSNFSEPTSTPPPPSPEALENVTKPKRFMTLAERLEAEGIEGKPSRDSGSEEFGLPQAVADRQKNIEEMKSAQPPAMGGEQRIRNLLPMGTFIPCVLESDIITTDLSSNVWATVVLDVTFRRQLQLPKGLVRLRGKTASEPVQNMVDIHFDVMLFSDGAELPINGFAYATFDPRYPNRFKVRGIPGEMIVPPLYLKLQGLVYSAALGASDAYIQNFANENTTTPNTFTTVPYVDPVTGQTQSVITQEQGNPVNNRIGETVGLSAAQGALEEWVTQAQKDLEKYRPYVVVEKGTPIFVQLDETVDVAKRTINGVAIAQAEAMAAGTQRMGARSTDVLYPPGDARSQYSSRVGNSQSGTPGSIAEAGNDFLKQLQSIQPADTTSLQQSQQTLQRAQESTGQGNPNLQQVLQEIGGN